MKWNKILTNIPDTVLNVCIFMLELFSELIFYSYNVIKMYRALCYTKLTIDAFPTINQFEWPVSALHALTSPYFQFWRRYIPHLQLWRMPLNISIYFALELLNLLINKFSYLRFFMLVLLDNLIEALKHLKNLRGE